MTGRWSGRSATSRSAELPPDWQAIRVEVLDRDGWRCVWEMPSGERCPNDATDVDHIGSNSNHSPENLRALCGPHHDKRTARQGAAGAAQVRPAPARRRNRDHPFDGWR